MRASLLLNCSRKQADEVRKRAKLQSRTVSGYVLHIVMRAVSFGEDFDKAFETMPHFGSEMLESKKASNLERHYMCIAVSKRHDPYAAPPRPGQQPLVDSCYIAYTAL